MLQYYCCALVNFFFHNQQKQIPMAVAKVIVQVAFNAIAFKDVARKQLISCVKKYGLIPSKECQTMEKEKAAQIVATYLLENGIVQISKELKDVQRGDIVKKKAF